jgi:hypothetical protein
MPLYRDPLRKEHLYEVIKVQTCSGEPLEVTTASGNTVYVQPAGVAGDAFGRLRTSSPLTLFDSSHRYRDNGQWATSTGTGGTYVFSSGEGLVNLNVTTASGAKVLRETKKVCSYQPGKSLQVMNTFVMAPGKANLRQRVGYFGSANGIYVEVSGTSAPAFVERNSVSGFVTETRVPQTSWNVDKLDGQGPSGFTLDITKAQIHWADIEWLGLGSVRTGFVLNGQLVHCHSFHHANLITSTYMTTASLPMRYEIENLGTTASSSTLKQVCSTVLSEGGYELRGAQSTVGIPVATPYDLTNASTFYPVISIRLKADYLDAVVILTALCVMGITNNAFYNWKVIAGGATTGGTWVSGGTDSAVEYNISGTSFTDTSGRSLASGFTNGSNQGSAVIDILKEALFKFQLERDSFTSTPYELTLVMASEDAGADVLASLDWEEVSR